MVQWCSARLTHLASQFRVFHRLEKSMSSREGKGVDFYDARKKESMFLVINLFDGKLFFSGRKKMSRVLHSGSFKTTILTNWHTT
jgi:hypothetical protein